MPSSLLPHAAASHLIDLFVNIYLRQTGNRMRRCFGRTCQYLIPGDLSGAPHRRRAVDEKAYALRFARCHAMAWSRRRIGVGSDRQKVLGKLKFLPCRLRLFRHRKFDESANDFRRNAGLDLTHATRGIGACRSTQIQAARDELFRRIPILRWGKNSLCAMGLRLIHGIAISRCNRESACGSAILTGLPVGALYLGDHA